MRWIRAYTYVQDKPQPFYPVDPPQEFDEPGKELGVDAQLWKIYVRETDQVDGELVDRWIKSMDVILIFAALFSVVSTAFVIESYKNLKPDPADISVRTLLIISQTLATIANGSQPSGAQSSPDMQMDTPPFLASRSDICVNVLWFLSLSLSVAVSLISMLAKEWCLKFMSGRTGPPGLQARRRQQRWDKLLSWKLQEVLMILPSLIHLSLLLFAIGLSVFLWDLQFNVAIPVLFVTTIAAAVYIICTVLPFIDEYCPYGTVLSLLCRRSTQMREQITSSSDFVQDETTAKALHWMIENCKTPRSVDVALHSLAGATKDMPYKLLAEWDTWTTMRRRLGVKDPFGRDDNPSNAVHARALHSVAHIRANDGLKYGSKVETRRLEALALGLQSCIDSLCHKIRTQDPSCAHATRGLPRNCTTIGVWFLKYHQITPMLFGSSEDYYFEWLDDHIVESRRLLDSIVYFLEQNPEVMIDPGATYPVMSAIAAFILCSCSPSVIGKTVMKLLRVYHSRTAHLVRKYHNGSRAEFLKYVLLYDGAPRHQEFAFLLGLLPTLCATSNPRFHHPEESFPATYKSLETSLEYIWQFLIAVAHSGAGAFNHYAHCAPGVLHLLSQHLHYDLSPEDCDSLAAFAAECKIPHYGIPKTDISHILNNYPATHPHANWATLPPQVLDVLNHLLKNSMPDRKPFIPTPEIYLLTIKSLCQAETAERITTGYELMGRFPFPKLSPRFIQLLSTSEIFTELASAQKNNDPAIQAFATAQLWLFFSMSLEFPDRTSEASIMFEHALLEYPLLEGDVDQQELVARKLETQLMSLLEEHRNGFGKESSTSDNDVNQTTGEAKHATYIYRILGCTLKKQGDSLPEPDKQVLEEFSNIFRGLESSYLEGEEPTKDEILPDGVDSDI
ncbi:unnamed protein product [Rhizoctonia solani]|uniref:DUF6535 domain-containing protein n=1 Tax=Rhizoctonia solani TaxID=456999 RepID=A0A8H3BGP6_9AGAM|nr:unnamed protein product [Rhizoctonia solani]